MFAKMQRLSQNLRVASFYGSVSDCLTSTSRNEETRLVGTNIEDAVDNQNHTGRT